MAAQMEREAAARKAARVYGLARVDYECMNEETQIYPYGWEEYTPDDAARDIFSVAQRISYAHLVERYPDMPEMNRTMGDIVHEVATKDDPGKWSAGYHG